MTSLFFSLLVFPTTPFNPSPKDAFSSSIVVVEVAFSSQFFYSNDLSSISLFRRHCDVALFNPSFCSVKIMLLSFAYPFNRSVVSSAQVLFILSSFVSLFNRSADRSCSSLFLFANGVLSTSFISVVFFSRSGWTSSRFVVSLVCQRSNLVLPLLFLFRFPPVPF